MNIKANELRLGNLIRFNNFIEDERNVIVNARFFASMAGGRPFTEVEGSNNSELNNYYSGIVLTPEILEKCGFEKDVRGNKDDFDGEEIVYHKEIDIYHNQDKFLYATYTRYPGRGFKGGVEIKYLHQLQNLYFCLVGEELEVKL